MIWIVDGSSHLLFHLLVVNFVLFTFLVNFHWVRLTNSPGARYLISVKRASLLILYYSFCTYLADTWVTTRFQHTTNINIFGAANRAHAISMVLYLLLLHRFLVLYLLINVSTGIELNNILISSFLLIEEREYVILPYLIHFMWFVLLVARITVLTEDKATLVTSETLSTLLLDPTSIATEVDETHLLNKMPHWADLTIQIVIILHFIIIGWNYNIFA